VALDIRKGTLVRATKLGCVNIHTCCTHDSAKIRQQILDMIAVVWKQLSLDLGVNFIENMVTSHMDNVPLRRK